MKKVLIIALIAAVAALSTGCTPESTPSNVNSNTEAASPETSKSDAASLSYYYTGNPTTGYLWNAKISDESIASVDIVENDVSQSDAVGGSVFEYTFTVKGLKPGEATVSFIYGRPWEDDKLAAEIHTYKITVASDLSVSDGDNEILPDQRIDIPGNATTGYFWTATSFGDNINVLEAIYSVNPASEGTVGAGGTFSFPIYGLEAGKGTIEFSCLHAGDYALEETKTVDYIVNDDLSVTIL